MLRKNSDIKEIIDMVYNIYDDPYVFSSNGGYKNLSELTSIVWDDFHYELIKGLSELDSQCVFSNSEQKNGLDFQLLWYDSLGFPQECPKIYHKNGDPIYICYGRLPSRINEITLHDAEIVKYYINDSNITLHLKTYGHGVNEIKIEFNNISVLEKKDSHTYVKCDITDILEDDINFIVSGVEIPAIDYIFKNFSIPREFSSYHNRYFYVDISIKSSNDRNIIIVFDKCNIKNCE